MTRIPDAQLDRLKRDLPLLVRLVEASGVELRGDGENLIGRCPMHKDRTPSFVISRRKVLWHCMGACQAGGSAIDFVMKRDGLSFVRAVKVVRDFAGAEAEQAIPESTDPAPESTTERTAEELAVLDEVARFYTESLRNSPKALTYLERRGLVRPGLIERFRLGFADQTLARSLPPSTTPEGKAKRAILEGLGLFRQGYEHFAASIVIPILDAQDRVVGMYGRRISPPSRGKPAHRYLPGPHRGIFNARSLAFGEETIICEALIDALTLISAGFENVISAYGVEGFTPEHFAALELHGIRRALIAYDRDAAGDSAALELGEKLKARGIACYRVELPKGMDINEYAVKLKPAEKSLEIVLRKAVPMGDAPPRPATIPAPPKLISEPVLPTIPESDEPTPNSPLAAPEPPPATTSIAASFFAPPADIVMHEDGEELYLSIEDRVYRVRGLSKNSSLGSLKINLSITRGDQYFVDSLDLCQLRPRKLLERLAAAELGLSEERMHHDLGKVLRKLEELQRDRVRALIEPKTIVPEMSTEDKAAAMSLLQDPSLLDRILSDFARAGVVGEETNKLLAYLVAVSRKLDEPLAVIVQSSSAAGKSSLVEAVLAFMPEEDCLKYSAMTGQSLYYMTTRSLEHKILSIAEEEGASRASYALKLLLSERRLIMAAPTKDDSGTIQTKDYLVEGPVAGFLTTTSYDVDEELQNRCIVLAVDESRAQTQAIHIAQRKRETLDGLIQRREKLKILRLHHNAQRLLRSLHVANPQAEVLTFRDLSTRSRRDHPKYLGLIRAVALLRQYQKEVKTVETELGEILEYIEVEAADIEIADRLARDVLEQSAAELPAQTARLLQEITSFVKARAAETKTTPSEVRFTRREIREATGMGNTRLKIHMKRLEDLEHVVLRGGRGYRFDYQLVGTASVETPKRSPPEATWSPLGSKMGAPEIPSGRGRSPHGRPPQNIGNYPDPPAQSPTWSPLEAPKRNGAVHLPKAGAER